MRRYGQQTASATGQIRRNKTGARHLKTAKSPKRRRNLRHSTLLSKAEKQRVERMLPYA